MSAKSTRSISTRGQKKQKPSKGLTPELLEKRVKQLMQSEVRAEAPRLTAAPKGTLEQIGHEADQAWSGVKKIMSLLNVELKHVYYNATNVQITQAGSVLDLCSLISQGVGGAQRIGDSLKIKAVKCKFTYVYNTTMTTPGTSTVVLGMSRDGVPAVADVFAVVGNTTSGQAFPSDTYDKADHWVQHRMANVDVNRPQKIFELNHAFNHDVLYTNASTTSVSGNVWLAFISNEPTNYPTLQIALDIAFLDN